MTIEMKMDQRYEQGKNEGEQNRDRELIAKWLQKGKQSPRLQRIWTDQRNM